MVVELVLDSAELPKANAMGLLRDETLSDLLDLPFKDSLENELRATIGGGIAEINQLKPINIALTLSMFYIVKDKKFPLQQYTGSAYDGYFSVTG